MSLGLFKKSFFLFLFVFVISFLNSAYSSGQEVSLRAKVSYEKDPKRKIQGLVWTSPEDLEIQIRQIDKTSTPEFFVTLKGSYSVENHALVVNLQQIEPDQLKNFSQEIVVQLDSQTVIVDAIGPTGVAEHEVIEISVPQFYDVRSKVMAEKAPGRRFNYTVGIGPSLLHYQQTDKPSTRETAVTLRAAISCALSNQIEMSFSSYLNTLLITSNGVDPIRFLGVNARMGYVIHAPLSHWKLVLNGGLYYVTSFAKQLGFENLYGPQLYPLLRHSLPSGNSVFGYIKFSPIADRISVLTMNSNELAAGGGYSFFWNRRAFAAGLDLSSLTLDILNKNMTLQTMTLSLGMGL